VSRVLRLSELADEAGVSLATVKYYQREGLLPAARKVGERRAEYDERHLRRLRLLRVMRDVGGVPVERLRSLVEAVEDEQASPHEMFGVACDALNSPFVDVGPEHAAWREIGDDLIAQSGWDRLRADAPDRDHLAALLEVVSGLSIPGDPESALAYFGLVDQLARFEIESLVDTGEQDRGSLLERMVVGQVVFGQMLLVLRRIAEEHHSALRFA
jgi:DNA-binding transcriptional MerR regulator